MKEYICERCGLPKREHIKTNFVVNGYECRDIGWVTLCAGSGYRRNVDLCETCMEELSEWMEGPQYTIATPISKVSISNQGDYIQRMMES